MSPKKKKCDYNDVINPALDQILKMAPGNAAIRTQVHAEVKQAIPDEIQTYEGIVAWVEETYDPKLPFGGDETLDHSQCLLKITESGSARGYKREGNVRLDHHTFKIPLKDLARVFLRCHRERRSWAGFRNECNKVAGELLLKQVQADPETHLKLAGDVGISWGEIEVTDMDMGEQVVDAVLTDSGQFYDQLYYKLASIYPDQINAMARR